MKPFLKIASLVVHLWPAAVQATDAPREIAWEALVPPVPQAGPPNLKLRGFLANAQPPSRDGVAPAPQSEARWMSSPTRSSGTSAPAAVVQELNGHRVRIGGYVVALDFEATKVKEFLLVPFVGACIHVPPPPPNQIIYVKAVESFEVKGQFDPVYVTGILKTAGQLTGLAATGYTIESEKIEFRRE